MSFTETQCSENTLMFLWKLQLNCLLAQIFLLELRDENIVSSVL